MIISAIRRKRRAVVKSAAEAARGTAKGDIMRRMQQRMLECAVVNTRVSVHTTTTIRARYKVRHK